MTQQTLTQFLATANADDATALAEAQAFTQTQGKLIPRNTMNSILAQAGLYNAFLAAASTNDLIAAFMDVSSTEYNFIQGNATGDLQIAALDSLIAGDYPELAALKPTLIALCNVPFYPFENTTIEQVKGIRNPATWQSVTNVANAQHIVLPDNSINGNSATGGFRLTALPAETFNGTVKLRVFAKRADDTVYALFDTIEINMRGQFTAGEPKPIAYQRTALLKGFRHFKFEYLEPYAGALTEVTAEGI